MGMKKFVCFALATGLVAGLGSCKRDDVSVVDKNNLIEVRFAASTGDDTRVSVDGKFMKWAEGDAFSLWDNAVAPSSANWPMTLASGAGTASATFSGSIGSAPGRTKFYAVHPTIASTVVDLTAVPIAVPTSQSVAGPNDPTGVGAYMVNVGQVDHLGDPAPGAAVALAFAPLTAIWDVAIANPGGLDVKGVRIEAANGATPFVSGGTVDITQDYTNPATVLTVGAPIAANNIATTWTTASGDASLTARIVLLPTTINADLRIVVVAQGATGTTDEYVFTRTGVNRTIERGVIYHSSVDLSAANATHKFTIDAGGVLTTYTGPGGEIRIPDAATSTKVGSTSSGVFMNSATITSVDLNNVTSVGFATFNVCTKLATVVCPNLTTIGGYGFRGCSVLTTIDLSQVTSITGNEAFKGCPLLEDAIMPNLEGVLPFQTFMSCTKLKNTNFAKVTAVGAAHGNTATSNVGQCFANCDALISLSFPSATYMSWRSVNPVALKLTSLSIPNVEFLGPQALGYCDALTYLSLPKLVTIGNNAFNQATNQDWTIDLTGATGITTLGTNVIRNAAGVTVIVANSTIQSLFTAAYPLATIQVAP
ncbi:hypothetical protein FACS1894159_00390 [Bacteroidia bacterium]|nr:hypothetical protein FACS1894159_00390 [Bacteroidia bacterium]